MRVVTSENSVPVIGYGPGDPTEEKKSFNIERDFDFSQLEFNSFKWNDMFYGLDFGDNIRVTVSIEKT